jgi:hypothetical protein
MKRPAVKTVTPIAPNRPVDIGLYPRRVHAGPVSDQETMDIIRQQGEALETLKRSHAELTQKVAALQAQSDRSIVGLLQGISGLEQRLQTAKAHERVLHTHVQSARRLAARQERALSSMTTTARINQVNSVVNSVQAAAFGEKGSLLATNNLLLAANQLLWQFADPILRGVGFALGPSPSLLTWLSPVGGLLTGQLVVGNRQHVRFVSGVVEFDGSFEEKKESLRSRLPDSFFRDFKRRTDVPVTAVPIDDRIPAFAVSAKVEDGVVIVNVLDFSAAVAAGGAVLSRFTLPPRGKVAWMVDTGVDGG